MSVPFARSLDEAHLYMELRPCDCGAIDFGAQSTALMVDDRWIIRYAGRCAECGRDRAFDFRTAEEIAVPEAGAWADGPQPSELLDAGEWLWVADTYGDTPADIAEQSEAERDLLRTDLLAAAAAIDEVLKFLPDGATDVPDTAFWSPRGLAVRAAEPGRFHRPRLVAARDTYRRSVPST